MTNTLGYMVCPKCKAHVERIDGCPCMTCPNEQCKQQFCYLCGSAMEGHTADSEECKRLQQIKMNELLAQSNEQNDSTQEDNQEFDVLIFTTNGKKYALKTKSSESVDRLKEKVQMLTNINKDELKMIVNGKMMENGNNVGSYNVRKGSTINIIYRVHGGN